MPPKNPLDGLKITGDKGQWNDWSNYVLIALTRSDESFDKLDASISTLRNALYAELATDKEKARDAVSALKAEHDAALAEIKLQIAMLKIKAGVWGALAGLIPALTTIAIALLLQHAGNGG